METITFESESNAALQKLIEFAKQLGISVKQTEHKTPNRKTIISIKEAENNKLKTFDSVNALLTDLNG